ncbi:MAG: hypothetical protein H6510_12820 [Acidobacteria bacterium]|nr:hypothetical protein [Acidobacteriota bacterium]MCB9398688.1 hypothetical protein [Acidobacteriota bacterium]
MLSPEWREFDGYGAHSVIKQAWQEGAVGVLDVQDGETLRQLFWSEGRLVFASSNDEQDRLPEILIQMGHFDREQFQELQPNFNPNQSIGRNLVESGLITQKDLIQGAKRQVSQVFEKAFRMASGQTRFLAGEEQLPSLRVPLELPVGFVNAIMGMDDRAWLADSLKGHFTRQLMILPQADQAVFNAIDFSNKVLPLLDGSRDFNQISFECDVEEFRLLKLLYLLQFLEWLEVGGGDLEPESLRAALSGALETPAPLRADPVPPEPIIPPMAETVALPRVETPAPRPFEPEQTESLPAIEEVHLPDPDLVQDEGLGSFLERKTPFFAQPWFIGLSLAVLASCIFYLWYRPQTPQPSDLNESLALFPDSEPTDLEPQPNLDQPPDQTPQVPVETSDSDSVEETAGETVVQTSDNAALTETNTAQTEPQSQANPIKNEPDPPVTGPSNNKGKAEGPQSPVADNWPAYPKRDPNQPASTVQVETAPKRQMQPPEPVKGNPRSDAEALQTRKTPPPDKTEPNPEVAPPAIELEPLPESGSADSKPAPKTEAALAEPTPAPPSGLQPDEAPRDAWLRGDYLAAAQGWRIERADQAGSWTISLELACETTSVQNAPQFVPNPQWVWLLPKPYNGRPCYWICYGTFEGKAEAEAALTELDFYRKANTNPPRVVTLGQLF